MGEETPSPVPRLTLDRLCALTDGILAVVITILVLGIDVPEDHSFSEQGLLAFFGKIRYHILAYAASFWLIASYWLQHHAIFHYLRYCNRQLFWLNTLFLFPLTLVPFFVRVKSVYGAEVRIVLVFGTAFIVCGLALLALWRYAISRPELLRLATIDRAVVRSMTVRILIGPVISLVAMGLSFLNVYLGTVIFLSMPLFYISHYIADAHWEK